MCYEFAPISMGAINSCIGTKNITIFPNIEIESDSYYQPNLKQIGFLIKILLRESCMDVWMYSRTHKRSIQLMESNFQHLLDTDIAAYRRMDENELIEFTSNLPKAIGITKQSILYINHFFVEYTQGIYITQNVTLISKEFESLQKDKKYNIIVLCDNIKTVLEIGKTWLPKNRYFMVNPWHPTVNQNLHIEFINILRNPDYDRFKQYQDYLRCLNEQNLSVFFWHERKDTWKEHALMMIYFIKDSGM